MNLQSSGSALQHAALYRHASPADDWKFSSLYQIKNKLIDAEMKSKAVLQI
jgi:hypothetical protein